MKNLYKLFIIFKKFLIICILYIIFQKLLKNL